MLHQSSLDFLVRTWTCFGPEVAQIKNAFLCLYISVKRFTWILLIELCRSLVDPLVEMQQLEGVSCSQQRLFLPNMERASKASALLSRLILLKYPQILISSRKKLLLD
jgi:hypothetical protein